MEALGYLALAASVLLAIGLIAAQGRRHRQKQAQRQKLAKARLMHGLVDELERRNKP